MALDSTHPKYNEYAQDWVMMRDLYKGERAVKGKREVYLPPTKSMMLDGMKPGQAGYEAYNAYLMRANYHDYVKDAVENYVGMLHSQPSAIELPKELEYMRTRATQHGESLEQLLRRINEEQLVTGRVGLLLDVNVSDPTSPKLYIAFYVAESIRNWDDNAAGEGTSQLNLVILDESGTRRVSTFDWTAMRKYRVLVLGPADTNEPDGSALYRVGVFDDADGALTDYAESDLFPPMLRGEPLKQIPFVFANTKDVLSTPDEPPLLGLGHLSLTVYRSEADYRQNLFMQGQDTLVVIGEQTRSTDPAKAESPVRTGAGSMLKLDSDGDAKYIGVNSRGLPEQRLALQNDKERASEKSGKLVDTQYGEAESGNALQTRIAAQTSSLMQITKTAAAALEKILKIAAVWSGADPEKVKITPNTQFGEALLAGDDLVKYMTAKNLGAPISNESIHALMTQRGLTRFDYRTEVQKIDKEEKLGAPAPIPPGSKFAQNLPPQNNQQ